MNWIIERIATMWNALMRAATVKVWAQVGAAMSFTVLIAWMTWIIWKGPWEKSHQAQQLNAIFFQSIGVEFLMLVALVAMTGLSVKFKAGKDGLSGDIDQDEPDQIKVTTTTETTVTPPGAAEDPAEFNGPRG